MFVDLREKGGGRETDRETSVVSSHTLTKQGSNPHPRLCRRMRSQTPNHFGLQQQSPNFLAPGTSFLEENFSTDSGWRDGFQIIQTHYIQAHLLLCGPVPNRPRQVPVYDPEVGDPWSTRQCSKPTQPHRPGLQSSIFKMENM